jgi:hypothetical protein
MKNDYSRDDIRKIIRAERYPECYRENCSEFYINFEIAMFRGGNY